VIAAAAADVTAAELLSSQVESLERMLEASQDADALCHKQLETCVGESYKQQDSTLDTIPHLTSKQAVNVSNCKEGEAFNDHNLHNCVDSLSL
jgi:hypothetical protein